MSRVFIDGGAGTTGLEIRERLAGRGDLQLVVLPEAQRRNPVARAQALNTADAVILCLPDDAAREAVSLIEAPDVRVIDASTAHRTDPAWTYGFAEIEPDRAGAIAASRRVSNPGCYPTGFLALVRPLVREGLIRRDLPLSVNAVSGYSGGGKAMIAEFEAGAATAFRGYALGLAHKHVPEMQEHGGLEHPPLFAPAVARTYRGMIVEVPIHAGLLAHAPSGARLRDALAAAYATSPLVRVANRAASEALGAIEIEAVAGSDRMELHVFTNEASGHVRLVAVLDNLGKGAAGAAVQNLNLMLGRAPTEGLLL